MSPTQTTTIETTALGSGNEYTKQQTDVSTRRSSPAAGRPIFMHPADGSREDRLSTTPRIVFDGSVGWVVFTQSPPQDSRPRPRHQPARRRDCSRCPDTSPAQPTLAGRRPAGLPIDRYATRGRHRKGPIEQSKPYRFPCINTSSRTFFGSSLLD